MKIIVAITGASGAIYARQALEVLTQHPDVERIALILSDHAADVMQAEGVSLSTSERIECFDNGDAGRMIAPASVSAVMLRRWISEYGLSRTTMMRGLRSLSITSAARSMSERDMPDATRATVPIEAGMTTIASQRAEPLATDAHISLLSYRSIRSDVGNSTPSARMTSSAWSLNISATRSTSG